MDETNFSNFGLKHHCKPSSISDLYVAWGSASPNFFQFYLAHWGYIPNTIIEDKIDCKKLNQWIQKEKKKHIKSNYFIKRSFGNHTQAELDEVFYFLDQDIMISMDHDRSRVRILFQKSEESLVDQYHQTVLGFKKKDEGKPKIHILHKGIDELELHPMELSIPSLSIEDNYNEDLLEVNDQILHRLKKPKNKGIVLLHGKPGTGKTTYIRYLLSQTDKKAIFLPPNMAEEITNPHLVNIFIDNPNSIFVIEDAENILTKRDDKSGAAVSTLLNISDGLLSDCLNIQLICSFNTELSKVDNALLRKGRLIAKYEFKELSREKAQNLSDKLGFEHSINSPMTLTDIYNQEEKQYSMGTPPLKIGF